MSTLFFLCALLAFIALVLTWLLRGSGGSAAGVPVRPPLPPLVIDDTPDLPEGFGYKMSWLAMRRRAIPSSTKESGPPHRLPERKPGLTMLRWVERPGGRMEQVELPLTPERFLNPQVGDQMSQGRRHGVTAAELAGLLENHFREAPDVLVLFDVKHVFGPELPGPGPDVSVIRGIRDKEADRESFDAQKEGAVPCLIIEVVSPRDSRIRRADVKDKVEIYERARVQEYVIVDSSRQDRRFRLLGYRQTPAGRYLPIEPDAEGRILSEATDLWFQVAPDGNRVLVFEHPGGRQLLNLRRPRRRPGRPRKRLATRHRPGKLPRRSSHGYRPSSHGFAETHRRTLLSR